MPIYRITFVYEGVPARFGPAGAEDITNSFKERAWHRFAHCTWDGSRLILTVENDFDENGLATQDEFSDEISANLPVRWDGLLTLKSVEPISK